MTTIRRPTDTIRQHSGPLFRQPTRRLPTDAEASAARKRLDRRITAIERIQMGVLAIVLAGLLGAVVEAVTR